jgi:hypothetical protein
MREWCGRVSGERESEGVSDECVVSRERGEQ